MRTRIALAAIIPVALITVSTLTQTATAPSARALPVSDSIAMPAHQLAAYHVTTSEHPTPGPSNLLSDLNTGLLAAHIPTPAPPAAPTAAAPTPAPVVAAVGPVDTVTPAQRAAWERVAMCEEGGNWAANGSRFSGGLGITRSNWIAYGGQQFAPAGAMATEDQQIMVAERIQSSPPDQYGCRGW
jgi:hypothetical protein